MKFIEFIFALIFCLFSTTFGLLFPQQNEFRLLDSLDGLWTFVLEPFESAGIGLANKWANLDLSTFQKNKEKALNLIKTATNLWPECRQILEFFENSTQMPVPAAFNDLSADSQLREHVGWVWYQREYRCPEHLLGTKGRRSFLRFGSVQYAAIVFLNGEEIGRHIGGHLPFQMEVSLNSAFNTITVAVNNTLSDETIPPGSVQIVKLSNDQNVVRQIPNFDFFNYAGILRPVHFWHLPQAHINAIKIIADSSGDFSYRIDVNFGQIPEDQIVAKLTLYFNKTKIAEFDGLQNSTKIQNAKLWWPRGMGEPNLYLAEIKLEQKNGEIVDIFRETFGFRSVSIDGTQIRINGRPFYCHGFGMHEDFEVHGRGFDRAVMTKDLNMFEWLNGNCYRTSHYPYSEERAYEADRRGIAVITEVPAVGLRHFTRAQQTLHGRMITEMVMRDWNHPSTIMWSLANEPEVHNGTSAYEYFKDLVVLTKHLDGTRPVTVVFGGLSERKVAYALDVICLNRYYGWYSYLDILEAIQDKLTNELNSWHNEFKVPLILSEYGAEAIPGMHDEPSAPFTEQYQAELIQLTGQCLDKLQQNGQLAGEMLWNFADFMTSPSLTRVVGNHKGVLTRARKPKMGAYIIQERYAKLMEEQKERRKMEL